MWLNKKICFMSVSHSPFDDRIYKKEALTLAENGFEVYHLCYGSSEESFVTDDNIHIIQLQKKNKGKSIKTILAALKQTKLQDMFNIANELQADVYHLHDVELCRIAIKLKKLPHSPKVIYDAHEPYLDNLIDFWQNKSIAKLLFNDIPAVFSEKKILKKVDFLIATEENVANMFWKKNKNCAIIYNYSFFFLENQNKNTEKIYDIIYCGKISKSKGIFLTLNALIETKKRGYNYSFLVVGNFESEKVEKKVTKIIKKNQLEKQVKFIGQVKFEDIGKYYNLCKIGLCILYKNRSNKKILPIKIFEYPAFGLPIVGSNFGHIGEIIKKEKIGITVNQSDSKEVAKSLIYLLENSRYKEMQERCINCVKEKYLWENQKEKLLNIYKSC